METSSSVFLASPRVENALRVKSRLVTHAPKVYFGLVCVFGPEARAKGQNSMHERSKYTFPNSDAKRIVPNSEVYFAEDY